MIYAYVDLLHELYTIRQGDTVIPSERTDFVKVPSREEAQEIINILHNFYRTHTDEQIDEINSAAFTEFYEYMTAPLPARSKSLKKPKPGYVYLLRSVTGLYKIGLSKNPQTRIKTLDVKLPFEIEPVCIIKSDDMKTLEASLHDQFASKRVNGEWFALEPEDVEYIRGLAS